MECVFGRGGLNYIQFQMLTTFHFVEIGFPTFSSLKTQKTTPQKSEDWNKLSNNEHRFVFKLLKYPNYILDLFPVLRKLCLSAFEQHLLCGPQPCQVNKALINY